MTRDNRVRLGLLLAIAGALLVSGCGSPAAAPPASPPSAAGDAGAQLVETKCSMCHGLDRVTAASYDKAGWEEVVTRMEKNGLVVTPEEKQAIVESLSAQ
jgi:cytochrome c5